MIRLKPSYLITGPRQAGKSTLCWKLVKFLHGRGLSLGGVLTIQEDSKSFFLIRDQQKIPFEASGDEEFIPIGQFKIHKVNLERVRSQIIADLDTDYFFLDEIGILELMRGGFFPVMEQIISRKDGTILVIRESILDQFLSKFSMEFTYEIINVTRPNFDEIFAEMKRKIVIP